MNVGRFYFENETPLLAFLTDKIGSCIELKYYAILTVDLI